MGPIIIGKISLPEIPKKEVCKCAVCYTNGSTENPLRKNLNGVIKCNDCINGHH